jgi:hypothetical protein
MVKNREYHIRARRVAVERELRRLGIRAFYRRPDPSASGPDYYRPPERPQPGGKSAPAPERSQDRVTAKQLSLEFPLSEDELREEFNRLFPPDDAPLNSN